LGYNDSSSSSSLLFVSTSQQRPLYTVLLYTVLLLYTLYTLYTYMVTLAYVPFTHSAHSACPPMLYPPRGHGTASPTPALGQLWPAGHATHAVDLGPDRDPAPQTMGSTFIDRDGNGTWEWERGMGMGKGRCVTRAVCRDGASKVEGEEVSRVRR
jgi:hypothetical protein